VNVVKNGATDIETVQKSFFLFLAHISVNFVLNMLPGFCFDFESI